MTPDATTRRATSRQRTTPRARRCAGCGPTPSSWRRSATLNPQLKDTQFADYHGHGWIFRAVYKQDRKGNLLDKGPRSSTRRPARSSRRPSTSRTSTLEKGMHCVDCHFKQDVHGNGKIYGESREAIEIDCIDCHGTRDTSATLVTTGPAAPPGGTDLADRQDPLGRSARFEWIGGELVQRSHAERGRRVGGAAGRRRHRPAPSTTTRRRGSRRRCARRQDLGRRAGRAAKPRARQRQDGLLRLPLRRGSPAASAAISRSRPTGRSRQAALRGRRHRNWTTYNPQVAARRHLHARPARHGEGPQIAPGALVQRGPDHQHHERQPRAALLRSSRPSRPPATARQAFNAHFAAHRARKTRPRPAPTATSPRQTTTTPGWRSC